MWHNMFPVIWLDIQGQRYPLAVDTAARAVTPVLFLCPQPSWVAVSPPPAGPGTHPPSLCTILEGLKGVVLVEVVASTHPHQQVAVEACLYTSTPPPWPCCSSTTSSLTSEVSKHAEIETKTWSNTDNGPFAGIIAAVKPLKRKLTFERIFV